MSNKGRKEALRKGLENIDRAQESPVDANAIILGNFLEGYVPAEIYGPGVVVMTTDDIISALGDMADLAQADVNQVLATTGFMPGRNDAGSFGWLMRPVGI